MKLSGYIRTHGWPLVLAIYKSLLMLAFTIDMKISTFNFFGNVIILGNLNFKELAYRFRFVVWVKQSKFNLKMRNVQKLITFQFFLLLHGHIDALVLRVEHLPELHVLLG